MRRTFDGQAYDVSTTGAGHSDVSHTPDGGEMNWGVVFTPVTGGPEYVSWARTTSLETLSEEQWDALWASRVARG